MYMHTCMEREGNILSSFNDFFFHFTSDSKEEFEITIDGRETISVFVDKEMAQKLHARGKLTQVSCNRGNHNDIDI